PIGRDTGRVSHRRSRRRTLIGPMPLGTTPVVHMQVAVSPPDESVDPLLARFRVFAGLSLVCDHPLVMHFHLFTLSNRVASVDIVVADPAGADWSRLVTLGRWRARSRRRGGARVREPCNGERARARLASGAAAGGRRDAPRRLRPDSRAHRGP